MDEEDLVVDFKKSRHPEDARLAEMIVVDANILIRAVLGRRVRQLVETYAARGVRFLAPEVAFEDATKYLPPLLRKRAKPDIEVPASLEFLQNLIENRRPGFIYKL